MKKLIFLLIIMVIPLVRYFAMNFQKSRHLIVSFFIMTIPFQVAFPIVKLNYSSGCGTLGPTLYLLLPLVMALILIPVYQFKLRYLQFDNKFWPFLFLFIVLLSFLNPLNAAKGASFALFLFVASHFLFFKVISRYISQKDVVKGTFDALVIMCSIQLFLAICFPLLGIKAVTGMFFEVAEGWATRQGTRPGAVGTFTHPGNLALFTTIASSFFLGCYLTGYNKRLSLVLLICNFLTVILTYSRTSYLTIVFDLVFLFFVYKNAHRNIFSVTNLLKFLLPVSLVIGWIVFYSPFSDVFLKSDADEMYLARMMHWLMALDVFTSSPIIGSGLNAHLEYFAKHSLSLQSVDINNLFLTTNPIHNIHLIVLAENGIVGFVSWWAFIIYHIVQSKNGIADNSGNKILLLTRIGLILAYAIYGITGWAPFSPGILPFFLYFTFFASHYNKNNIQPQNKRQMVAGITN